MGTGSDRKKERANVRYFCWREHLGILLNILKYSHVRLNPLLAIASTELHGQSEKCIFFPGSNHCVFLTLTGGYRAWTNQGRRDAIYQPLSLPTSLLLGRCQQPPNSSTNIGKMGLLLSNRDVRWRIYFFPSSIPPLFFSTIWE